MIMTPTFLPNLSAMYEYKSPANIADILVALANQESWLLDNGWPEGEELDCSSDENGDIHPHSMPYTSNVPFACNIQRYTYTYID